MKRILLIALLVVSLFAIDSQAQTLGAVVTVEDQYVEQNQMVTVPVVINVSTQVSTIQSGISFDTNRMAFVSASTGPGLGPHLPGATFTLIDNQAASGKLGLFIQLPASSAGFQQNRRLFVALLTFQVNSFTTGTPISFTDNIFPREVRSSSGGIVNAAFATGFVWVQNAGTGRKILMNTTALVAQVGAIEIFAFDLDSQANENGVSFSLYFDPSRFAFAGATLGPQAQQATLLINQDPIFLASGNVGFALALPAGQAFSFGGQRILFVQFRVLAPSGSTSSKSYFFTSDIPIQREVATVTAATIRPSFQFSHVSIAPGTEGDIAPRPNGNLMPTLSDWVLIGRLAAGLEPVVDGFEFQKADCAPRPTLGDGRITLADWVQAGRYAAGLDPFTTAGGPTTQNAFSNLDVLVGSPQAILNRQRRIIESARRILLSPKGIGDRLVKNRDSIPQEIQYSISLHGRGDENAVAFTLEYDADELELLDAKPADERAAIHLNRTESGRVGIVLALPPGQSFGAGEVLVLRFSNLRRGMVAQSLHFADGKVAGEVVTVEAQSVPAVFGVEVGRVIRRR